MKYETKSAAQTKKIAKLFAQELAETKQSKEAFVIILKGDLGAGKTTFIQGLMRELGVRRKIVSPTFTLLRSYRLSSRANPSADGEAEGSAFTTVHHFDCYRMGSEKEINDLGFKKMAKNPQNIILIEWPERVAKALPRKKIIVSLEYGDTLNERTIEIK